MKRTVICTLAVLLAATVTVAAQHSDPSTSPLTIDSFIRADSIVDVESLLASEKVGKIDLDGYRFNMTAAGPKLCRIETGSAADCLAPVKCAAIYDGMVVFGGMFGKAGDSRSSNIVGYDGRSWVSLGQFGINKTVFALEVYNGRLIAAGEFDRAGNDIITHVAAWDGRYWSPMGDGLDNAVFDLVVYDGQLVAGGDIAMAATCGGNSLSAWNGSKWLPVNASQYGYVYALMVAGDGLFASGKFIGADGTASDQIIEISHNSLFATGMLGDDDDHNSSDKFSFVGGDGNVTATR